MLLDFQTCLNILTIVGHMGYIFQNRIYPYRNSASYDVPGSSPSFIWTSFVTKPKKMQKVTPHLGPVGPIHLGPGPGPICSILRFCHERGPNKRWGAVRHVKRSGISIRVFLFLCLCFAYAELEVVSPMLEFLQKKLALLHFAMWSQMRSI